MNELPPFEELLKMDKDQLEDLRKDYINRIINSAKTEEQKRKLEGLQFKIDMIRRKHKNPMGACIEISKMMHESFIQLRDALKEASEVHKANMLGIKVPTIEKPQEVKEESISKILEFKREDK